MAAPRKLPPVSELKRLIEDMGSVTKVARHFGVGRSSVYRILRQEEEVKPENEFMPWNITREHSESSPARMLRLYNRITEHEIEVPEPLRPTYEAWIMRLVYNNFVICYHPESPPTRLAPKGGFFFRPRRPDDSPGLMQQPAEDEQPPSVEQLAEWVTKIT